MKEGEKELKTLKDIMPEFQMEREGCSCGDLFDREVLRDAAREWIKELEIQQDNHRKHLLEKGFDRESELFVYAYPYGYDNIIDWIKHFFNLSEDE